MPRYLPVLAPLLLLLLLLPLIAAWRPTDRTCGGTTICLTSFKWCEASGARECYYPPNVYSQSDDAGPYPALVWEEEYEISWKGVKQDSGTVTVQWIFLLDGNHTVVWETELAALNNNIKFKPSSSMFLPTASPEPISNITFDAAQGLVTQQSMIRIRQGPASGGIEDTSDTFVVLPSVTQNIIDRALEEERRTWKKKMTVALIVGILGSASLSIAGTWFWMRWWLLRMRAARIGRKIVD
ncbi:hypothetical protein K505DRAFT_335059 [Melanomma pulvis-pyrius CBS 109.77]|uniref:Uncharacterized protein n=1 Tax=Melanomma pulvis-pyrius CBS 109.77 TaxID=1314802 RepID=A0A6A6XK85_9PLEO|nr:hypothetical protein K505DRAFT_335059 [Melanomma pulvis-pyrius CBS 109.77]